MVPKRIPPPKPSTIKSAHSPNPSPPLSPTPMATPRPHSPTLGPHSPTLRPHSPTLGLHSPNLRPHSPIPSPQLGRPQLECQPNVTETTSDPCENRSTSWTERSQYKFILAHFSSPSLQVLSLYYRHVRVFESSRQEFSCSALPQQGKRRRKKNNYNQLL